MEILAYAWKCMEMHTHGNAYAWKCMEMHTHGNAYAWKCIRMEILAASNTHGVPMISSQVST